MSMMAISLVISISLGSLIDKLLRKAICGIIPSICLDAVCTVRTTVRTEIGMWNDLDDHRIDATKQPAATQITTTTTRTTGEYTSDPYQSSVLSFGKKHTSPFTMKSDVATTKASEASGNSLRNGAVNPVVEVSTQVVEEAIPGPCWQKSRFL
jgi:hypothetical protein